MSQTKTHSSASLANSRSTIYGFLAAIYRQEVSSDLLQLSCSTLWRSNTPACF
jgi:hypothetical protein